MASVAEMEIELRKAVNAYRDAILDENEADANHQKAVHELSVAKNKLRDMGSAKSSAKAKVDALVEAIARGENLYSPGGSDYTDETRRMIADAVPEPGSYL